MSLVSLMAIAGMGQLYGASDIAGVTVESPSGTYITGQNLVIHVTFDVPMDVTVGGSNPVINLNTGGTATYTGGAASGTTSMDFAYTISSTDSAANLQNANNPLITLNGGTIVLTSSPSTSADLSFATTDLQSNTGGGFIINIASISLLQVSDSGENYTTGQAVLLSVTFTRSVAVTGTPTIALNSNGTASYYSGSGSTVLNFLYLVGSTDESSGLKCSNTSTPVALPGGATISSSDNPATDADLNFTITGNITSSVNAQATTINYIPAATITAFSVVQPGGAYGPGSTLDISVTFSTPVVVAGGTPSLGLNSKGTQAQATATYASGSGSNILTFQYLIASGNSTAALAYLTNGVALNGATITNLNDSTDDAIVTVTAATLTSAANGQTFSISSPTPCTVTAMSVTQPAGNYLSGQSLSISVTFSGAVDVVGTPTISLDSGSTVATYVSGSGSSTLAFTYLIGASDTTTQLDVASTTPFNLPNGATISNTGTAIAASLTCAAAGAAGSISHAKTITINQVPCTITSISAGVAGSNYVTAQSVSINVVFSAAVTVNSGGGVPSIALNSGGIATYASGSTTNTLVFSYVIGSGDFAPMLNVSANPPIVLNGGSIASTASGVNANLAFVAGAAVEGTNSLPLSINGVPIAYLGGGTVLNSTGLTFPPPSAPLETVLAPSSVIGPSPAASLSIASLTVTLLDHPDGTAESLGVSSTVTLTNPPFSQVTIGSFSNLNGSFTITTGSATTTQTLNGTQFLPIMQAIVYRNTSTSATAGARTIQFQLTDTAGRTSAVSTATVTVSSGLPDVSLSGLSGSLALQNSTALFSQANPQSGAAVPILISPSATINNPTPIWNATGSVAPVNPFYLYVMSGNDEFSSYASTVLDQVSITLTNPDATGIFPGAVETISVTPALLASQGQYSYAGGPIGNFIADTEQTFSPIPMYSIEYQNPIISTSGPLTSGQNVIINAGQSAAQVGAGNIDLVASGKFPIPTYMVQAILQNLTYTNTSNNPAKYGTRRTITVVVTNTSTAPSAVSSAATTCSLTIVPTNYAPTITGGIPSFTIDEDAQNAPLSQIHVGDFDGNGNIESVTLSVSNGTLSLDATGVTASVMPASTITLTGPIDNLTGALAHAVSTLTYTPTALYNGADTLTVSMNDNGYSSAAPNSQTYALTATKTFPISVIPVSHPPVVSIPAAQVVNENAMLTLNQLITVSDPDLTGTDLLQVTLSVNNGLLTLPSTAGLDFSTFNDVYGTPEGTGTNDAIMTFRGSINAINAALAQVIYDSALNYYGGDTVTVQVNNLGQGGIWDPLVPSTATNMREQFPAAPATPVQEWWVVTQAIPITVAFVNQIPTIAANVQLLCPAGNSATVVGGTYVAPTYPVYQQHLNATYTPVTPGSGTAVTSGSNLVATDVETIDDRELTYTILLAPTQGTLTLYNPVTTMRTTLQAGTNATFTQHDLNNGYLSYTHGGAITGNDSFVFSCSDDNQLTYAVGASASQQGQGINNNLTTNIFQIQIVRLNPAIVLNGPNPVTFQEFPGTVVPIIIDNFSSTQVVNGSDPAAFVIGVTGIGSLTMSIIQTPATPPSGYPAYTDAQDVLGISPPSGGAITATLTSAPGVAPQTYNLSFTNASHVTNSIGVLTTGTVSSALSVQFSSPVDIPAAAVTALLKTITFSNPSQNPSNTPRQISVTVTNGAGYASPLVYKTINVLPCDIPPTISAPQVPAGFTVPRVTITGSVGASSPDSILTFAVASPPGKGTVTVANNIWTYTAFAGSSGTDTFSITVGDLGIPSNPIPSPTTVTQAFQVQITPIGVAATPLILSNAQMEIEQGGNLTYTPVVSTSSNLSFQLIGLTTSSTVHFNQADGTLTWTGVPLPSLIYYNFGIMVTDTSAQLSSFQPMLLKVFAAGSSNN